MLSDDIELVESTMTPFDKGSPVDDALRRIKTALGELYCKGAQECQ